MTEQCALSREPKLPGLATNGRSRQVVAGNSEALSTSSLRQPPVIAQQPVRGGVSPFIRRASAVLRHPRGNPQLGR